MSAIVICSTWLLGSGTLPTKISRAESMRRLVSESNKSTLHFHMSLRLILCRCEEGFCSFRRSNLLVIRRLLRAKTVALATTWWLYDFFVQILPIRIHTVYQFNF